MIYGVKVIHTHTVGSEDRRFYEESILKVDAESFEEAYDKAEKYIQDAVCAYKNIYSEDVKTISIEAIDCFCAFDPEGDVQEIYSSFYTNRSALPEDVYYKEITSPCDENELRPLRNIEFN